MSSTAQDRLLKKKMSRLFSMRGLTLRPDAMEPLMDALRGDENWENTLNALFTEVQQQQQSGQVDGATVHASIRKLRARTTQRPILSLEAIGAFSMPALRFDSQRRALMAESAPTSLHAAAQCKSSMYSVRLAMIEDRTRRHDMFKPPVRAHGVITKEYIELTSIDALLGRAGVRVVLGFLAELEEGVFYLEDGHATLPIDLSEAAVTAGLFTRHSIVLAEGEVLPSGIFKVSQLGLPPPEPRTRSLEALGNLDPLRASVASSPASVMSTVSSSGASGGGASGVAAENAMLVVLSDVWLDDSDVLRQLATLLRGYEQVGAEQTGSGRNAVPLASFFTFVLCGNFASPALAASTAHGSQLRALFKTLSQIVARSPTLARHAHFVLVPGPDDPSLSAADVLPRSGLPRTLTTELVDAIQHCELATSPARLQLCGKSVVIHREELLVKARRACVMPPNADEPLHHHLVKSLIDQVESGLEFQARLSVISQT